MFGMKKKSSDLSLVFPTEIAKAIACYRRLQKSVSNISEKPRLNFLVKRFEIIDVACGRLNERLVGMNLKLLQAAEQLLYDAGQGKKIP
jgi:hypothetical protein